MKFSSHVSRIHVPTASLLALVAILALGCSDDDKETPSAGAGTGGSGSGGPGAGGKTSSGDTIDEAVLAKCPQESTLIQTTEWMSCMEGKRLPGVEPFNAKPCELRIGTDGAFEYLRDGEVTFSVPARDEWNSPTGTYQNTLQQSTRIFLASVDPDLDTVEGQPRLTRVDLNLVGLAGQTETVEISYLDAGLARQTYNCNVDAL